MSSSVKLDDGDPAPPPVQAPVLAAVDAEDLANTIRVLNTLGTLTRDQRQSPAYRDLRHALHPFIEDFQARFYRGSPGEQQQRTARRRLQHAEQQRQRALDRNVINSRQLRASRIESLKKLQTLISCELGTSVPLIPDGAATTTSSASLFASAVATSESGAAAVEESDDSFSTDMDVSLAADAAASSSNESPNATLFHTRSCYTCKARYSVVHFFYDRLCPTCADFNYQKRLQTADLQGYYCIVTGGRVKIGYQIALKLLRCGANVVVTSRFPHDAAVRFSREADFTGWKDKLSIFGIDLRNLPSLERFCLLVSQRLPHLDILINNACQTVRRPTTYYKHLMDRELETSSTMDSNLKLLLQGHDHAQQEGSSPATMTALPAAATNIAEIPSAVLAQVPVTSDDCIVDEALFPVNVYDTNLQQLDLRTTNSWLLKLDEVHTGEVVEVFSINAIAPFVLNGRLKPLMLKSPHASRYIVNVSAMEGKFYRHKMPTHPHTNMAKAALNMMTRTSASDYAKSGIFMTAVDTGWINDENPLSKARDIADRHDFQTPIDEVDAAARVLDPVFLGVRDGRTMFGVFMKDYVESEW